MEWSTHALSGVVLGYAVTNDWKGAVVGGIAGVIPDLDEPRSRFGKIFFPISYPLNIIFGHRTFTHSLLFTVIVGVFFYFVFELWLALAVMAGILAHILGDMLTGKVELLYPVKKPIGILIPRFSFLLIDRIARIGLTLLLGAIILSEMTQYVTALNLN